jgi:hypothetical protein
MGNAYPSPPVDYPAPPRVHWLALIAALFAINTLIDHSVLPAYRELVRSLIGDGWVFYLCLWIRKLDSDSYSPFWCDVYVVIELAYAATTIWQKASIGWEIVTATLEVASVVLGIATIFLIRRDLVKHYNEREDFTLILGPVMTLFFSFIYFQYHLYDIAKQKLTEQNAVGM